MTSSRFFAVATYHSRVKKGDGTVDEHREETEEDAQHSRARS
jgi:hypothetical protein